MSILFQGICLEMRFHLLAHYSVFHSEIILKSSRVCRYKPSIFKWNTMYVRCKFRLPSKTHLVNACHLQTFFFLLKSFCNWRHCCSNVHWSWTRSEEMSKFTLTIKSSKNSVKSTHSESNYKSTNLCVRCPRFSQKLLGFAQWNFVWWFLMLAFRF